MARILRIEFDQGIKISDVKSTDFALDVILEGGGTSLKDFSQVTDAVLIHCDSTLDLRLGALGNVHTRETKEREQRMEGMNDRTNTWTSSSCMGGLRANC